MAPSNIWPSVTLSTATVERIGTVALIVILFNGGASIGLRRFKVAAIPIVTLGIAGTFLTAGLLTLFIHLAFGTSWMTAGLLAAAIAPTDPAVMFSVLGDREVGGRTGTILEGESGANDPVGIALMLGLIELATHDDASAFVIVRELVVEMGVGVVLGILGALAMRWLLGRVALPAPALGPVLALALAGALYGATALAHGSGFLAVFIAGLVLGDSGGPYKAEIQRFHGALAVLAEIAVFGVDDATWGNRVVAAVVGDATDADLDAYARTHLAPAKRPKEYRRMSMLPRTATGKVLRRELS